jgi:hypothetical protein
MVDRWATHLWVRLSIHSTTNRPAAAAAPEPPLAPSLSPAPTPSPACGGGQVSIDLSDGTNVPGLAGFQHVVNIIAVVTVVGCLLAVVGGIFLATSGRFADHRAAVAGRLAILAGLLGAFGVAIAAPAVNFALNTGAASC